VFGVLDITPGGCSIGHGKLNRQQRSPASTGCSLRIPGRILMRSFMLDLSLFIGWPLLYKVPDRRTSGQ
jgi:hypothetical protein